MRVSYDNRGIHVNASVFDCHLWYDESLCLGDLTAWNAVSLYLDKDGNVGGASSASVYTLTVNGTVPKPTSGVSRDAWSRWPSISSSAAPRLSLPS